MEIEMALKIGNRNQYSFLPPVIDKYVGEDDPVRVYDAFVETLDFEKIGIDINNNKVGNSSYDPKAMMKLLVYGYSYGIRSSRKLERATKHNLSFIWLMGDLKPDHKTIANYRKNNKKALKEVLVQSAQLCMELNLIDGNILFLDGSKIRGNSSINKTRTKEGLEKQLKHDKENINPHDVFFDMFNLPNVFGITQSHKAKMVLMQSLWACGTFASAFDLKEKIDQATGKRTFERTGKFISDKAVCRYPIKVFVHDECSMYSQQMLDYVLKDTNYSGKIIFMGERLPM